MGDGALQEQMTIDEFARVAHTSTRNVRGYVERGLLPPPRLVARTGYYDEGHVERMEAIQRLQADGFSLAAIRAVFDAWEAGTSLGQLVGAQRALGAAKSGATDASTLFPQTKFQRPPARDEHIRRQRCLARLDRDGRHHVLISAPGGTGKSTLAAQLVSAGQGPAAWVSLEAADAEPGRFLTAVLIGIRTALPDFGDGLLGEIVGGARVDRVLVEIADELASRHSALSLVLDDLHEVNGADVMQQVGWFIDRVDADACRLIMCSRTRPPLPTSRLVVTGRLIHLETGDLPFDENETREFLVDGLGVQLSPEDAAEIAAAAGGWAAAVYLAGLSLRAGTPKDTLIASLAGGDRRMQEYFAEEVLTAVQPAHVAFLEEISILERFTAELCDAVRRASDSQAILDELDENMFVIPLDPIGHWRRLHHSLTAVFQARTSTAGAHDVRERRCRAGAWYESHDLFPEAIDQYAQAGSAEDVARVLGAIYPKFMNISHQGAVVGRWLAMLPTHVLAASVTLGLASASLAGLRGEQTEMEQWLTHIQSLPAGPDMASQGSVESNVAFMRACFHFGEIEHALGWARTAYAACPPGAPWFPMHGANLALLGSWVDGPTDEVLELAHAMIAHHGIEDHPIALAGVWALKGVVLAARGDPGAGAAIHQAAQIRTDLRIERAPQAANIWTSTARAYRLLGDQDSAATCSAAGYAIVRDLPPERDAIGAVVPALIELAFARRLQGRTLEAAEHIEQARRRLRGIRGPGLFPQLLAEAAGDVVIPPRDRRRATDRRQSRDRRHAR